MSQRDRVAYDAAARSVHALIDSFRESLGPLPPSGDPALRTNMLIHALVEAASIKLHCIFAYAYPSSRQICLSAARKMIKYADLNVQDIGYINPIMGVRTLDFFVCLKLLTDPNRTCGCLHVNFSSTKFRDCGRYENRGQSVPMWRTN